MIATCWTSDIVVPIIWATFLGVGVVALATAYVRSRKWQAIERQGWPKPRTTFDGNTVAMLKTLRETQPQYTYTSKESPVKDDR